MKNYLLQIFLSLLSISAISPLHAQNEGNQLVLTLNMPKNESELNAGQLKKLEAKVLSILTANGIATEGIFSPFIATPSVNFYDLEVVEGLRKLYVVKGEFSLSVGLKSGEVFSSETIELIGSGTSEQQAKNDFINKISGKAKNFSELFTQAVDEVNSYYANNCDQIINEVTNLRNTEKYEQALIRLSTIPSYAEACYAEASQLISEAYQEYQDRNCGRLINIAESAIALRHYQAAVEALAQINPKSSCYDQSLPLKEEIKAATQDYYDKIWQQQQDVLQSYTEILKAKYENQTANAGPAIQIITPSRSAGAEQTIIYDTRVSIHGVIINPQSAKRLMIDELETSWDNNGEFKRALLLDTESKNVTVKVEDFNGNVTVKELFLKKSQTLPPSGNEPYTNTSENLRKVALVIGNGKYESGPLRNPPNDADAMSSTLRSLGFEVTPIINADSKSMYSSLGKFLNTAKGADVTVIYYSGHGFEINGENYLIPVDNGSFSSIDQYLSSCINVSDILKNLESHEDEDINIVILDACRTLGFKPDDAPTSPGLASVTPPAGTIIAYATAPGTTASDGFSSDTNGMYTGYLIEQMVIPQRIEDVFMKTRNAVLKETNNGQRPWEENSLNGIFYLKTP